VLKFCYRNRKVLNSNQTGKKTHEKEDHSLSIFYLHNEMNTRGVKTYDIGITWTLKIGREALHHSHKHEWGEVLLNKQLITVTAMALLFICLVRKKLSKRIIKKFDLLECVPLD